MVIKEQISHLLFSLVKPKVPPLPHHMLGRGFLVWFHGSVFVGSVLSVSPSDQYLLSSLPIVCGVCTVGSAIGMRLCYVLPSLQIIHIARSLGFETMYNSIGMRILGGTLEQLLEETPPRDRESGEAQFYEKHMERMRNVHPEEMRMKQSREDLWQKILDRRTNSADKA